MTRNSQLAPEAQHFALSVRAKALARCLRGLPIRHGKHRLLDMLGGLAGPLPPGPRFVREGTAEILLDPSDLVGRHYLLLHTFDPEVVDVLAAASSGHREVAWDIGANKGVFCYQLLRRVPNVRLVAFEPQRQLAEVVRYNLGVLCPGRFEVFAAGLGEVDEKLELVIPCTNTGRATLHATPKHESVRRERVQIITPEHAVRESKFGRPTLIKVDVEGHEPQVIRALSPTLREMTPKAIVFEHHGGQDDTFRRMFDQLSGYGYGVFAVEKSVIATTLRSLDVCTRRVTDYVALRRDIVDPHHSGRVSLGRLKRAA